jgi:diguanylate cyclase (GGDEF)-like protein
VLTAAAARAMELFRADAVELVVPGDSAPMVVRGMPSGVVTTTAAETGAGESMAVTRLLQAPSSAVVGELRLCFYRDVKLTERESRALSTFSNALTSALLNADLYEQMSAHAARKAHEAAHDPLTGLANRTVLVQRGTTAIESAVSSRSTAALLLLDLDHFKEVNDTLGHEAGDLLLLEVAGRLDRRSRHVDTVVRLGGDEFAILLTKLPNAEMAETVATSVLSELSTPVAVHGLQLPVEASIGIACAPADALTVRELLRCADVAMYQAKRSGKPVQRYRSYLDPSSVDRLSLVAELPTALERGELIMHYQPKVDLNSGQEIGVEALARWQHPRRGLLGADDFISLAEHSGIVHGFSLHVLDLALEDCARWMADGRIGSVAVNLSARNLLDNQLPKDVAEALDRHGVPANRLILEITETVMMSELEVVENVLAGLRALGCQLSVDDFGTGYSSLTFLSRMRIDEVKIDRSFVNAMLASAGDAAIVRAILELAHSLELRVVAEGVETAEQAAALTALGCDAAQGFYVGAPRPYAERHLRAMPTLGFDHRSAAG